jgi:uncharacterized membrane protein YgdD (TMEM256/DUF423 family)
LKTSLKKENKPAAKVVSITQRKWLRYAAAAMVIGILTFSGIKYFKPPEC